MAQNITIGFIGYGNMAQAIAQGLVTRASSTAATSSPARRITTSWKPALRSSGRVHCTTRVRSPPRPTW